MSVKAQDLQAELDAWRFCGRCGESDKHLNLAHWLGYKIYICDDCFEATMICRACYYDEGIRGQRQLF